jgi:hypothetical protein
LYPLSESVEQYDELKHGLYGRFSEGHKRSSGSRAVTADSGDVTDPPSAASIRNSIQNIFASVL